MIQLDSTIFETWILRILGATADEQMRRLCLVARAALPSAPLNAESSSGQTADPDVQADVRQSQNGDGDAYARIIRRYQDTLSRRMFRFSRRPADVEELVHDVFVEAYFSLKQYRADAPFEHWLQAIATRVGYRFWKRRRQDRDRLTKLALTEHPGEEETESASDDASEMLATVLEQLPPRDRLVVTLLYLEERSVAEAAKLAGWSQTMIKVQAFRARGKLRKLLEEQNELMQRAVLKGRKS